MPFVCLNTIFLEKSSCAPQIRLTPLLFVCYNCVACFRYSGESLY